MMSASSSSSESIRDQIPVVHEIASSNTGYETVLESMQQKVDELRQFKEETYALRSQLQIVKETSTLQTAEFAFQKEQMEEEINNLKTINQQLSAKLEDEAKKTAREFSYEVKVKLESEKAKTIQQMERAAKWKARAKNAADQIQILQAKLHECENALAESNKNFQSEKDSRTKAEKAHEKATQDLASLKGEIQNLNTQNDDKQRQINELNRKLDECASRRQRESAKNKDLEQENEALKNELDRANERDNDNQRAAQEKKRDLDQLRRENEKLKSANKRYEAEIKSLQDRLATAETAAEENENKIGQAQDAIADLEEQNSKLKSENRRLNTQLQDQTATNKRNKEKIEGLEKDLTVTKLDSQETVNELQDQKAKAEEENEKLTGALEIKCRELEYANNENRRLQQKIKGMEEEIERFESEANLAAEERVQLEEQIANLMKELRQYEHQTEELEQALDELKRMKDGKGNLMKTLEVVPTSETEDDWQMMTDKAKKLIESYTLSKQLQTANDKLRDRLAVAADEIKRKNKQDPVVSKEPEEDVLVSSLQTALHDAQTDLSKANNSVRSLKLQLDFSHKIDEYQRKALREVTDLYQSVCQRQIGQLRALILSVVFARRLSQGAPGDIDVLSLRFFAGRPEVSVFKQIAEIRHKFNELDHDLVLEKQNKEDALRNAGECERVRNEAQILHENELEQNKSAERTIKHLERANKALEEKLAETVPAEEHQALKQKLSEVRRRNKKLSSKIDELIICVEEGNKKYEQLRQEYKSLLVKANAKLETASGYKAKYEEAKAQLTTLTAVMRENKQELFALERTVQRQNSREACVLRGLNTMAVENRCLKAKVRGEPCLDRNITRPGKGVFSTAFQVNPAFL